MTSTAGSQSASFFLPSAENPERITARNSLFQADGSGQPNMSANWSASSSVRFSMGFIICNHYIFQIRKLCCIILVEHRDSSFVVMGGTFIIKDCVSMRNLSIQLWGQAHHPTPTIIIEPFSNKIIIRYNAVKNNLSFVYFLLPK